MEWLQDQAQADRADIHQDHLGLVDWYINAVCRIEAEAERVAAQAAARLTALKKRRAGLERYLGGKASEIVRRAIQGKKRRSIDLASGRAGFRATKPKVVWDDDDAVKRLQDAVDPQAGAYQVVPVPTVKIDRDAVAGLIDRYAAANDGAEPDGVRLEGGGDRFYVSPPRGQKGGEE